ncbi:uncharacterized protein PSFLO_06750 [Pseudozyma flocculosa]|uniref:Uncharacterized protein n=1 Tax=Pseudozyma flocculosa TaxID=84751 RepID=A0A5C3F9Y8_9BASI|nr:uncharacterized protein PSFLO_06750 [Pseudozyma flocculosa]
MVDHVLGCRSGFKASTVVVVVVAADRYPERGAARYRLESTRPCTDLTGPRRSTSQRKRASGEEGSRSVYGQGRARRSTDMQDYHHQGATLELFPGLVTTLRAPASPRHAHETSLLLQSHLHRDRCGGRCRRCPSRAIVVGALCGTGWGLLFQLDDPWQPKGVLPVYTQAAWVTVRVPLVVLECQGRCTRQAEPMDRLRRREEARVCAQPTGRRCEQESEKRGAKVCRSICPSSGHPSGVVVLKIPPRRDGKTVT